MMHRPNGTRLTSDAALLLLQVIRLLVCHGSSHQAAERIRDPVRGEA